MNSDFRKENRERIIDYYETHGHVTHDHAARLRDENLGVEVEHFIVRGPAQLPVAYESQAGAMGVRDILERLADMYPERTYTAEGDLIGLANAQATITLEPAAQIELSIAPFSSIAQIVHTYDDFLAALTPILAENDLSICEYAYHPTERAEALALIPKDRYHLMDAYFRHLGTKAVRMMRGTTSTQVSIDYLDEADAVRKLRVASALVPILAAISDNMPVFETKPNTEALRRMLVWRDVDNARCGQIPGVFEEGFGFAAYADWMLATPPILVTRPAADNPSGPCVRASNDTSAEDLYADAPMEKSDIEHLISMFWPDVRLKHFIEIRPADHMPPAQVAGYAALIKGLFYSEKSLTLIEDIIGVHSGIWPLGKDATDTAIAAIRRAGAGALVHGFPLGDWVRVLFDAARDALDPDERLYLDESEVFARTRPWTRIGIPSS